MNKIKHVNTNIKTSELKEISGDIVNLRLEGPVAIIELNHPRAFNSLE